FSLYRPSGGESITLEIDKDNSAIAGSIGNFVDAYNEIRVFVEQQQERDATGALTENAVISNNSTMNTIVSRLSSFMSGQVSLSIPELYGAAGMTNPVRLGDLGIGFTDFLGSTDPENPLPPVSNILTVDAAKLNTMLESYF